MSEMLPPFVFSTNWNLYSNPTVSSNRQHGQRPVIDSENLCRTTPPAPGSVRARHKHQLVLRAKYLRPFSTLPIYFFLLRIIEKHFGVCRPASGYGRRFGTSTTNQGTGWMDTHVCSVHIRLFRPNPIQPPWSGGPFPIFFFLNFDCGTYRCVLFSCAANAGRGGLCCG